MIGIRLAGQDKPLQLPQNLAVEITLQNPILGDDTNLSPGSYSMPFDIPIGDASPENSRVFKNPDVIENSEAYQPQKATLMINGVLFKSGTIKPQAINGNMLSSYLVWGMSQISPDFKDAKLRDVLSEIISVSTVNTGRVLYVKLTGSGNATLEVNGVPFTNNSSVNIGLMIQSHFTANVAADSGVILPWADVVFVGNSPGGMTPTYIAIRNATIETSLITSIPGLVYKDDPLTTLAVKYNQEEASRWIIEAGEMDDYFNSVSAFVTAENTGNRIKFPVRFNSSLHPPGVKDSPIINGFDADGLLINDPNYGLNNGLGNFVKNFNSLQPFIHTKYILDQIAAAFGFEWEGDFYDLPDLANQLLDHTITLDVLDNYVGEIPFILWRKSFNLNEIVPDISVVDFLKLIAQRYNLAIYPNERTGTVSIRMREIISTSLEYDDITKLSSPIQNLKDARQTTIGIRIPAENSDALSLTETLPTGPTAKVIEIKLGRLHQTRTQPINGYEVTGPEVMQKAGDRHNARVFYWSGMKAAVLAGTGDEVGEPFNYPSCAISGDEFSEELINLVDGLYLTFHKYWLHYEAKRKEISINANFSLGKLISIEWGRKQRYDRNNYIIKSVKMRFTNDGVAISNVELLTMQ